MRQRLLALVLGGVLVAATSPPALATNPGAIFTCSATGQVADVDPIVSPGTTSAHPHTFYGARPVSTIESSADLRTKATTCVESSNHSAYWLPEVRSNGVALRPGTTATGGGKHLLAYYRCVFAASVCQSMRSFDDDTRLVVGNAAASSPAENPLLGSRIVFKCGPGSGIDLPYPPAQCSSSGVLSISFRFGACVSTDGTASVDPTRGACPAGYRPSVRVEIFARYWVGSSQIGDLTLGGRPYYTAHADYFFGWDRAAFDRFLDRCIRANVVCPNNVDV